MLGNNYKYSHAEDPDTQRKVNTMKHEKVFFSSEKKDHQAQSDGKGIKANAQSSIFVSNFLIHVPSSLIFVPNSFFFNFFLTCY